MKIEYYHDPKYRKLTVTIGRFNWLVFWWLWHIHVDFYNLPTGDEGEGVSS